ncbi:MAG TPA: hypothetical protein VNG90_00620 [Candidatus Acidoferrum sp.]|nr:hypothetical protein [Candidatus Acidoferrum sp.]
MKVSRFVIKMPGSRDITVLSTTMESLLKNLTILEASVVFEVEDQRGIVAIWRGHQFLGSLELQLSPALIRRYAGYDVEITSEVVDADPSLPIFLTQEAHAALRQAGAIPSTVGFVPYQPGGDQQYYMTGVSAIKEEEAAALKRGCIYLSIA